MSARYLRSTDARPRGGRSRVRRLLVGLALASCAIGAAAQKRDPCASPSTTIEINDCAQKVFERKDAELNRAYQALLKSLSPSAPGGGTDYASVRTQLADAQRAWISFRDSDCGAKYTLWEQGSIRGAIYLKCMTERTERRTAELRKWAGL